MLTDSDISFIKAQTFKQNKGNLTNLEKQKLYRIRKKSLKAIEDLMFIAEKLPEKQLSQIFNDDTINNFLHVVLHEAPLEGNKRVCKIVFHLIGSILGNPEFASRIVPKDAKWMIRDSEDPTKVTESLFFAASHGI